MNTVIAKEVKKASLKELVPKLMTDVISEEITKRAKKIFPIQNCVIRKVKTIKRPRFDSKLFYYFSDSIIKHAC